jgi:hypothetical protein
VPLWPRAGGRARRLVRALDDGHPRRPRIADAPGPQDDVPVTDPLGERTAVVFAAELAVDGVPSIRAIRAVLHVGQVRAQRLREYLAAAAETRCENLAA